KENGVTVLGTGINPGFLMDTWPLSMTAVCRDVEEVKAVRIQDASSRRLPFQKKIGAGRTPDEFQNLIDEGTLRHVGLPESTAMIAAGLGWELDEITEEIGPVMAESQVSSPHLTVEPGQAAGVKQISHGLIAGKEVVTLEFQAYIGAPETYDAVYIKGTPNMEVVIKGGTHGDIGTAAMVVNAARRVVEAPPGLLTMKDVPVVVCTAGREG
ncbi:MAG: dihydrodipicolinate reductase, partial [Candidatus Krumholzibacteria bacterium]|nr:dihydrodipicolinate reductase [Candidatus Krumholzibacteria bacterium]